MTVIPIPEWSDKPLLNEQWTQMDKLPDISIDQDEWEEDEVSFH